MVRTPESAPARFGQVPRKRGLIFICRNCGRPYACQRDKALRAWGELGRIADVCARLRCPQCRRRGMDAVLAPAKAELGSKTEFDQLVDAMNRIKPSGEVR